MNAEQLRRLLKKVKSGDLKVEEALDQLRFLPYEDIGFAKLDHHRSLRKGFPEVILCQGKTVEQVAGIIEHFLPIGRDYPGNQGCSRDICGGSRIGA